MSPDQTRSDKSIAIVGAGLVGSVMACYLAKRGYQVNLFERRADPRIEHPDGGRSINLALSNRGWKPLAELGLEDAVKDLIIPMRGRMMHDEEGNLTFQQYGRDGEAINSISRSGLNKLLLNHAGESGIHLHFNQTVTDVDFDKGRIYFNDREPFNADIILGADGAYSMLRYQMQRTGRFNYSQYFIEYGYKELTIPSGANNKHLLETNALHIWPRGRFMLIALPNMDGSFTCTLFLPYTGENSFSQLNSNSAITDFFAHNFADALALMPELLEDFKDNPTSSLVTIRCFPWSHGKVLLIGDASHGIVPFYGQGMNSGFEDCRVLNSLLDQHNDQWEKVIPSFQHIRKPDAEAIADLALDNFMEMRDLVADEDFLLRKKIEARLYELYPEKWIPLYSMVTFREDIRYSDARQMGIIQKKVMDEVMAQENIESTWEKDDLSWIIALLDKAKDPVKPK